MAVKQIGLVWIAVKDFKQAVKFYTEVVGLKVSEIHEEYKWAELSGADGGAMLGIGQMEDDNNEAVFPGDNGIVTLTVANLAQAIEQMCSKGLKLQGAVIEVPGHVKMQMFVDPDGNKLQLVEKLS